MSLKDWKEEFTGRGDLKKWHGTLPENLKRHGVHLKGHEVRDSFDSFTFSANNCNLCLKHKFCVGCPIDPNCSYDNSAWHAFSAGDPMPMIALMEKIYA